MWVIHVAEARQIARGFGAGSYALEYGENELTMQANTPIKGKRIVLIDDLLATGGTVKAAKSLIQSVGWSGCGLRRGHPSG